MSVRPIYQDKREVGKNIKSSKVLFIWKFNLDDRDYSIELYNSMLSGKKKITQNGQIIFENAGHTGAFNYSFQIGKNSLSLVQHGDRFELRINNQSFEHLYNQKMQKHHFATDSFSSSSYSNRNNDRGGPREPPSRSNENDEEEQIRKAIELSKKTYKKDEEIRNKHQNNQYSSDKDDFDVGLGFEKFATNVQGSRGENEDIDDFDFGNLPNKKEEENKQEEQFNFDISSNTQKQNQNKSEPAQDSGDLMDLLAGPSQQPQPGQNNQNALDFFSQGAGNGMLGQAAAHQPNSFAGFAGAGSQMAPVASSAGADPFTPRTDVDSSQQQQQQQQKPKFQPNPMFQTGMAIDPQQQYMQQMQNMQMQHQMMYQTQMAVAQQYNQAAAGIQAGIPPPGQGGYGTAMPNYGGGMQMNAGMGQQQNGYANPMMGGVQQQPPQQKQSTPFDF